MKALQDYEDVSNGNLPNEHSSSKNSDDFLEDTRESLHEGFAAALAVGKILFERLLYPLILNDGDDEEDFIINATEELEMIVDELGSKRQDIDYIVDRFYGGHDLKVDAVDGAERRKKPVREAHVFEEMDVFEEAAAVGFPNEEQPPHIEVETQAEVVSYCFNIYSLVYTVETRIKEPICLGDSL